MSNGAFVRYCEAGVLPCLCWTSTRYLVSKQDFVYDSPKNQVWTQDNIHISISLSLLLKVVPEHKYIVQMVTNVSEINELIDANIKERARAMGRSITAMEAYSLRGEQHARGMLEHLNQNLSNKGILIKRVIITEVELDQ